ncbi:MAG: toll/interleukin-1 receptor domain-containing protein [Anaerolineae bacterium]|nr:toll/interleukin-1 receptor domain-containing protein [Anaerolineae bacterium]MCI0610557.1 toll/interleukin-1 receptor domain-containing protein [Anaerolineae bacterium]
MATSDAKQKKLLIFLSHASQDKAPVRELCEKLKADGFDPWLDEERLLPGMNWDMEIEKALRASDAILLCFSELSVQKEGYIQREYKRAMRYQEEKPDGTIYVIPVRLDKCDVPYFIKEIQFVDYPGDYDRLVISLNLRSGKLASAPPVPAKKEPRKPAAASSASPSYQSSNISGGINIQGAKIDIGGDIVGGSKYVYGVNEPKKVNPLKDEFDKIQRQIDKLSDDPDVDKSYLKMFVKDIEREATKGEGFNEKKLRNSFKMLEQNSAEIYSKVADLLKAPDMNVPIEIQNLVD